MPYQVIRQALLPLSLFAIWMVLTFSGTLDSFDRWGLLVFRDANLMPMGGSAVVTLVTGVTHLGDTITLVILSLATIAWLLYRGRRANALYGALAITGLFLLSPLLKLLFGRARPDIVEHLVHVSSNSFPSGHAIRALAIYLIVYLLVRPFLSETMRKPCLVVVSIFAVATGLSRLYLGVHWPTDVVASWLAALFWLALWWRKLDALGAETQKC
jgi:undecaprenyl-diphosphatase